MHVLLVGASGFIGKCLAPYLIADGFEVSTLSRNPVACSGLFKQFIFPDFSRAPLGNCFSNIDVVVNLAGLAHSAYSSQYSSYDYRVSNVILLDNLLALSCKYSVARFINFSTVKVLGDSTPGTESFNQYSQPNPLDLYSISKLQGEELALQYASHCPIDVVNLRPSLVYGPDLKGNLALMSKALKAYIPLPLKSFTFNRRSLLNIWNLCHLVSYICRHQGSLNCSLLASDGFDVSTYQILDGLSHLLNRPNLSYNLSPSLLRTFLSILGNLRFLIVCIPRFE